jgi:glyoxylase-like metal-dependent hydrolase (beta-lactamase superfamily II)
MKKRSLALFFMFVLLISNRHPDPVVSKHFVIQRLAPGVWAAIANDKYGHAICNAAIIDLGDKALIFDPFMNIDAAKDLKAAAVKLTQKPVTLVINSHYHNDHIRGNQVFMPGASIISTEWTRKEMRVSEPEEIAWEKKNVAKRLADSKEKFRTAQGMEKKELPMWIGYYEGMLVNDPNLVITLPNLTFRDSLWIYGKSRNIKLVECKNGHTASDLILMLPKEGIVFMGDIFFVKRHPYLGDGSSQGMEQHLEKLAEDQIYSIYVPGHGPVGGKQEVHELIDYIKDIRQLVSDDIGKNIPDSIISNEPVPAAYRDWWYGRFYKPNLEFLCTDLRKK